VQNKGEYSMARFLLVLLVFSLVLSVLTIAYAGNNSGLTPKVISELKKSFKMDSSNKALLNAISANDIKSLSLNRELFNRCDHIFNFKIETKGVTDQQRSGRCWLFAGLNIMRPSVIKKYNLSNFEFSENYLFFWDKLEKANMFLDAIIETRNRDIDDRELQVLLQDPIPDGGWWSYVVALMAKYGAVPKSVMPETKNSSNTGSMNALLNRMARHDAVVLRKMARNHRGVKELKKVKLEMLKEYYRVLALHLGVPPEEFIWRYEDKDGNIHEERHTPQSFYRDVVGVDLADYVSIFDHPAHPYDEHYRIRYCRNMSDLADMDFVNVPVNRLKELALKSVLNGEPVWFAADVGKENDYKDGIMAVGIYDVESLLGVEAEISKADRVLFRESTPNHAMVFIGVDTLNSRARKWLVENSWGTDRGNKGYWTMYDNWFDEYIYAVIIKKDYLPEDIAGLFKRKAKILPAWDPMREMFK